MPSRLGVCSWSLQPKDPGDLTRALRALEVTSVQLALDPIRTGAWNEDETVASLTAAGISIASGMMGMEGEDYSSLETIRATGGVIADDHWSANLEAAQANAEIAQRLGLDLVTFHAGFIPHDSSDPLRAKLLDRLRAVIDAFGSKGIRIGFETGQETAATLLDALEALDRPTTGVNFDPANMILYGMGDPVDALRELAPRVVQVHIKDADPTSQPGTWGTEVPAGTGSVPWPAFFETLATHCDGVDLMIEREAGDDREGDIRIARDMVRVHRPHSDPPNRELA